MPSVVLSLRATPDEASLLLEAATALGFAGEQRTGLSQMCELAALEAAHRLGFYDGSPEPPRGSVPEWRDQPVRGRDTSATVRITIAVRPTTRDLLQRVVDRVSDAHGVTLSLPAFLIGATLRYVANKRQLDRKNRALAALRMPPGWR